MRVSDVLITKPSELAFYPIPKIFNARVGAHEAWGAIRSAELGDGTIETRTIPRTLQAIDLITQEDDLLEMFCDCIVKNKRIGIIWTAPTSASPWRPAPRGSASWTARSTAAERPGGEATRRRRPSRRSG